MASIRQKVFQQSINEHLRSSHYYAILLFAFGLSFGTKVSIYLLWVLGASWLISGQFKFIFQGKGNRLEKIGFFMLLGFFLLHILSLIYSTDLQEGLFDIEIKLSLFLFPLFLFGSEFLKIPEKKNDVFYAFIIGLFFASLVCYLSALYNSISLLVSDENDVTPFYLLLNPFQYTSFSLFHHPSYFAMYLTIGITIILYLLDHKKSYSKKHFKLLVFCIVFFVVTVFLLSSRAGILSLLLIFIVGLFYKTKSFSIKNKYLIRSVSLISLIIVFIAVLYFGDRFSYAKKEFEDFRAAKNVENINWGSVSFRMQIWHYALHIIKDKPVLGVGTGDVKTELRKLADNDGISQIGALNLNVHNQFMETWIGIGLVGFLLLISILMLPVLVESNLFLKLIAVIIAVNFLFESMLNRLGGVAFFSFFFSLSVYSVSSDLKIKSKNYYGFIKRGIDIILAFGALIFTLPVTLIISLVILLERKGAILYKQTRTRKHQKEFLLLKFRSMKSGSDRAGLITIGNNDNRITSFGKFLRKYKLDELPQLFNILKGDMSFVGPRPEVPKYVELYTEEQKKVLDVRPGLTDFASLKFFDENRILAEYDDPEKAYVEQVLPEKLRLSLKYIEEQSFLLDLKLIWLTIKRVFTSQ